MKNKFLTFTSSLMLALSFLVLGCIPASANMQDVVRDSNGGIVRDAAGDCVRTEWMNDKDECGTTSSHYAVQAIMGMDERIIHFDFDKSDVKSSQKEKLDTLAAALKAHNIRAVKVVGYTDKIGTNDYNQKLSHKRANAVKHYLDSKVKLDKSVVHLRALGKENQVKECEGITNRKELIECLAPNRRVEIEVDYYDQMK